MNREWVFWVEGYCVKDFFLRESERVVRFEGIVFSENESEYSEIIFPPFFVFSSLQREREN